MTLRGRVDHRPPLLIEEGAPPRDWVEAVREIPYGRPSERTVEAMLRENRGTCSLKHLYLAGVMATLFPGSDPQIVHRVYRIDRRSARQVHGEAIAALVPDEGLVDVHRYLTAMVGGRRIAIDATFSGAPWDGRSPMPLACGDGDDFPAGTNPEAEKLTLERSYCDPAVREPFIAALERRGRGPSETAASLPTRP